MSAAAAQVAALYEEEQTDVATLTESDRPGEKLFRRLGAEQRNN